MGSTIPGFLHKLPSKHQLFSFSRDFRVMNSKANTASKGVAVKSSNLIFKRLHQRTRVRCEVMQQLTTKIAEFEPVEKKLKKRNSIENRFHMDALSPGIGTWFSAPIGIASQICRSLATKAAPLIIFPSGKDNMSISSNISTAICSKFPSTYSTGNGTGEVAPQRSLKLLRGNIIKLISRELSKTGSRLNGEVDIRALEHRKNFIFKLPPRDGGSFMRKPPQKAKNRRRRNVNRIRRNKILVLGMNVSPRGIMDLNIFSMKNDKVFNHVFVKEKSRVSKGNSSIERQVNIPSDTRAIGRLRDGLTVDEKLGRDALEKKGSLRNRDITKAKGF